MLAYPRRGGTFAELVAGFGVACAVPKLAPYSELAFPVPVRPLCKARSTTWRLLHRGRRALKPGKGQIRD